MGSVVSAGYCRDQKYCIYLQCRFYPRSALRIEWYERARDKVAKHGDRESICIGASLAGDPAQIAHLYAVWRDILASPPSLPAAQKHPQSHLSAFLALSLAFSDELLEFRIILQTGQIGISWDPIPFRPARRSCPFQ